MSAMATTNANAFPVKPGPIPLIPAPGPIPKPFPPVGPGPAGPEFGPGFGFGAGLLGAAIIGSAIAASNRNYGCGWVRRYDEYGNYMGRVRVCN